MIPTTCSGTDWSAASIPSNALPSWSLSGVTLVGLVQSCSHPSVLVRPPSISLAAIAGCAGLQQRTLPAVVPRSIFSHQQDHWVEEELDGLELGHAKLHDRFARMLQDRWAHPDWSFYTSFGGAAGGKAAYAFIENPRAELQ